MEAKTKVNITISEKLLNNIDKNIEGEDRNAKFEVCILNGYNEFMEREKNNDRKT